MRDLNKPTVGRIVLYIVLFAVAAGCIIPFLIILGSSFQSQSEIMDIGYRIIPKRINFTAYQMIFKNPDQILNAYMITILTTVLTVAGGLYLTSTMAYVISRKDYKFKRVLSFFVFFTMLFNGGLVPTYIMISKWLNLSDTIWALVLPLMCSAWNIMVMKGFFASIPTSLLEAAKIDGAGEFRIFFQIVMPIAKPAFATIALFLMLGSWNDWYLSMLYIEEDSLVKLQYLLQRIMSNINFLNSDAALQYGLVTKDTEIPTYSARMAMCILASGPILFVFPFFQRYFVKGISVGSVKG